MRAFLLVASLCALLPALAFADPTEADLMGQAQRAYLSGDYATATQLFTQVLETDPQNNLAIQYLRKIRAATAGAQPPAKDPIKDLVLPKIDLKNATFSAALDFFKQQAEKQGVTVSFVSQLPADQMNHPVTLSLGQIPFLDALGYLCQLDNATYKVERYAIVILPAPAPGSSPTQ
jgi:thioredoxin-like negative regulator of GroEL